MPQPNRVFGLATRSPAPSTTASGSEPEMISDGKYMRAVWRPKHGDGDPAPHVIDRSKTTVRGHPTWKIFVDDIVQPIVRGNNEEPPRYVYLDDHACHVVWKSRQYTDTELKTYWAFDFDHQGNIKTGRPNRGRSAWTDSDVPEVAKGKLRGKGKWYEFSGELETTEYRPLRPATRTKMELQVEAEWAAQNGHHPDVASAIKGTPDTPRNDAAAPNVTIPGGKSIANKDHIHPSTAGAARLDKECASRSSPPQYLPRPHWRTIERPVTPPPKQRLTGTFLVSSSPPRSSVKSPDRKRAQQAERSSSLPAEMPPTITGTIPKRRSIGPFIVSSSSPKSSSGSPEHKCIRLGERRSSVTAELVPRVINANPNEEHGKKGAEQLSSLSVEPSELPSDVGSDSEDESFLTRKFLYQDIRDLGLTMRFADVDQTLKRKREEVRSLSKVQSK
ncbi:uncharacterized protein N0V89_001125 [Didymosphaeria variabile]|uniref:Uncharacterized protein n=1 Tax=Didymosphaeria variabile TaxID=1932322 RepID=A0A9W9CGG5_9PLEO|nr:uncharacterized protein N0V89_001125 [Didymosphaeria variabile]KAJ4360560.1 hypothetical protein N0V89_001125 [Didymosphaeria variabile]